MQLDEAETIIKTLIKEHLGKDKRGWTFKFNKRTTSLGFCCFTKYEIQLSRKFVENNPVELVIEVTLHEIAHALAGHKAGHGPKWAKQCEKLGIPATVRYQSKIPDGKYFSDCKKCTRRYNRQRKPKGDYLCPYCQELLDWKVNVNYV